MMERILLSHGGGGEMTRELLRELFFREFGSNEASQDDAAQLHVNTDIAFTTDSFVVSPLFFKGGDIGKLAVCGTINDICCAGATPRHLSCAMIIEEGFEINQLKQIVRSMADTAAENNVRIVTGDTKVVPKGTADGVYINTSGIGEIIQGFSVSGQNASPGDAVLVSGPIGMHGCAILAAREHSLKSQDIRSDCASVLPLLLALKPFAEHVHVLRDPTRGGLAATLNEIAGQSAAGMLLHETDIPINPEVLGLCAVTGIDPMNLASEGRLIAVVEKEFSEKALEAWRATEAGKGSAIIGSIVTEHPVIVALETETGGKRVLRMPSGELLPRIC